MRIAVLLLALLPLTAAPLRVSAQAIYYRSIPVGERAIGLGGAYTGISDDPSAAYYNPAGITRGGRFQFLGSLSSLVFTNLKVEDGFRFSGKTENLSSNRSTTLPRFVGTVVKFGRVKYGDHQFSVAYSTLEPQRDSQSFTDVELSSESSVDLRLSSGFRAKWYGASFAGRLSEKMSLGTTAYVAVQRYSYDEEIGLAEGGTLVGMERIGGESVTTSTEISAKTYHLALRLGFLYQIKPRWSWGLMFQPPGIPLKQKASLFRRATSDTSDPSSYVLSPYETGLGARMPIPFELRTGAAYQINAETFISSDFSVDGPVRDGSIVDFPQTAEDMRPGIYYSNSTERRWAPNAAVGVEHTFGKAVLAGGFFTNISAAPDVPESSLFYAPAQINSYGASLYVGLDTKGYKLSLGATGLFGRGDALAVMIDRFGRPISYERTQAKDRSVMLFVAGAVSVASKAAKEIKERHEAKSGESK